MALTTDAKHIETVLSAPGIGVNEVLRYLPILVSILTAFQNGTGTFSTNTPLGKRWVRVQDKPFPETD